MALANSLFIQGGLLAPRRGALEMCVSMAANTRSLHCFHASFRSSGVDISSTLAIVYLCSKESPATRSVKEPVMAAICV